MSITELAGYKPEVMTDDVDFKPLKGAYVARIDKIEHRTGNSKSSGEPYDFYAIKLQVTETIDGDKGTNRYIDKTYQNDQEGLKKFINDLYTANLNYDTSSDDAFLTSLTMNKDKSVKIRCWHYEKNGTQYQNVKVINDFKAQKAKKADKVPF